MSSLPFSKPDMFAQLDTVLAFVAPSLLQVYSKSVGQRRMQDWPEDEPLQPSASNRADSATEEFSVDDGLEKIFKRTLDAAFDYATQGQDTGLEFNEGKNSDLGWTSAWVADMECSALATLLNNNQPVDCQRLTTVLELTQARAVLDGECGSKGRFFTRPSHPQNTDWLSFREVALLAGIEERSVRNAASAKVLSTVRDEDRAYVHVHTARNWLYGRKGYVPSQRKRGMADRDLLAIPFVNLVEWSFYLHDRKTALAIADSELLAIVNHEDRDKNISDLNAFFPETEEEVAQTATLLKIDSQVLGLRLEELRLSMQLEKARKNLNFLAKESAK